MKCVLSADGGQILKQKRRPSRLVKISWTGFKMNSGAESGEGSDRDGLTIHVPPRYNQYGNRQVWFFETGHETVDNVANGALFAMFLALWFVGAALLRQGGL